MSIIREPRPMKPVDEPDPHELRMNPNLWREAMSREGKWTPGPWRLEHLGGEQHIVAGHNPAEPIVNVNAGEISPVNARLIAAAPQMAEALQDLLKWAPESLRADLNKARAALRAAGGE